MIAGLDGLRFQHWQAEPTPTARWCCRSTAPMPQSTRSRRRCCSRAGRDRRAPRHRPAQGGGVPLGQGQWLHRRRRHPRVPAVRRQGQRGRRDLPLGQQGCSSASPNCPAHGRGDPRFLAWAAAPSSRSPARYRAASNGIHAHRPAGSELGIFPGGAAAPAAPGRRRRRSTMMLTGRAVGVGRARMGLVDRVVDAAVLVDAAIGLRCGTQRRSSNASWVGSRNTWIARQILAPMMLKQVARKAKAFYPRAVRAGRHGKRRRRHPAAAPRRAQGGGEPPRPRPRKQPDRVYFFLQERLKGIGGKSPASSACTWSAPA